MENSEQTQAGIEQKNLWEECLFSLAITFLCFYSIYDSTYIFAYTLKLTGIDVVEPIWREYALNTFLFYVGIYNLDQVVKNFKFGNNPYFRRGMYLIYFPVKVVLFESILGVGWKKCVTFVKAIWPIFKWITITGLVIFGIYGFIQGVSSLSVHTLLVIAVILLILK